MHVIRPVLIRQNNLLRVNLENVKNLQRNDITIIGTYIDRAISGKTDVRPEFQRMIKDSDKKLFDAVIVWKLDRFARNRYDSATYRAKLKKNNVKVLSAKENITDSPEGIILESLLEGMAEYYSAELSQKIRRGMKECALKCKATNGSLGLGYKIGADKTYQIDFATAPIVQQIFEMYASGSTVTEIIKELNEKAKELQETTHSIKIAYIGCY